jgi:hypothetical protein
MQILHYCTSVTGHFKFIFMHLWPTYYTLEIPVYFPNLPQFTPELQILYSAHFPDFLLRGIIFSGMLYFHNIPLNIHNIPLV